MEIKDEKIISTAKNNFDKLVLVNEIGKESTKEECELKMNILQECEITFSTKWLFFWLIFGFGIGFIICIILGFSNKQTRMEYKKQELTRLQAKINNFVIQENYKKSV